MKADEFKQEASDMMLMLTGESDRASVLIAAAAINDELTGLLKDFFKKASASKWSISQ